MTKTVDIEAGSPAADDSGCSPPWPARIGLMLFVVAYLVFAVVTIATMQTGLHGDPRVTNPSPGPAPYAPFLGFDNWPLAVGLSSIPMAIGLLGALTWLSWRQRKVHWAVVIAFAGLVTRALTRLPIGPPSPSSIPACSTSH
jgi:hypothetical protein